MVKIGVFDSGIGGKRFAQELAKYHPEYDVRVVHDRTHMPYGNKTATEIQNYTEQAIQPLLGYDVIVIACNTSTAYGIDYLRETYPSQIFVGFEPAIKTAASNSKTRKVALLATPATLKSPRYKHLRETYSNDVEIIEPNVATLAHQIETGRVDWDALRVLIENLTNNNLDQIVLGCTHYHLIKNTIAHFAGNGVGVITPTPAVISRIESLLL